MLCKPLFFFWGGSARGPGWLHLRFAILREPSGRIFIFIFICILCLLFGRSAKAKEIARQNARFWGRQKQKQKRHRTFEVTRLVLALRLKCGVFFFFFFFFKNRAQKKLAVGARAVDLDGCRCPRPDGAGAAKKKKIKKRSKAAQRRPSGRGLETPAPRCGQKRFKSANSRARAGARISEEPRGSPRARGGARTSARRKLDSWQS